MPTIRVSYTRENTETHASRMRRDVSSRAAPVGVLKEEFECSQIDTHLASDREEWFSVLSRNHTQSGQR